MINKIRSAFGKKLGFYEKLLGIDIGDKSIKFVEIEIRNSRRILKNIGIIPIENLEKINSVEDYSTLLQNAFCLNGISAKQAILSIGGHNIFFREASFPYMSKQDLTDTVKWEIKQYVPYEDDTYYYDFATLAANKLNNEIRVMLVAGKKDYIDNLVSAFSELSINLLAIEGEVFALERLIDDERDYILIDIGKEYSQIIVYQDKVPVIARNISICGDSFSEAIAEICGIDKVGAENIKVCLAKKEFTENNLNLVKISDGLISLSQKMISEIVRTIDYYRVQNRNAKVNKIFLCGGGANLVGLAKNMMPNIQIPVVLLNPLKKIEHDACFDKNYINAISLQAATAIGLVLRGGK